MHHHTTNQGSPLARLRALAPMRSLDEATARTVAEHQAKLLLRIAGVRSIPVPLSMLSDLSHVELGVAVLPTSGVSFWTGSVWRLEANRGEASVRQRFTFAHEFKHVIDHPGRDLFYASHAMRERVADHFAACLLMPKNLVVRAWCAGEQDVAYLAELFVVSTEAMTRRLLTLGLMEQRPPRPIFCTRGAQSTESTQALQTASTFAIARSRSIGANT